MPSASSSFSRATDAGVSQSMPQHLGLAQESLAPPDTDDSPPVIWPSGSPTGKYEDPNTNIGPFSVRRRCGQPIETTPAPKQSNRSGEERNERLGEERDERISDEHGEERNERIADEEEV